MATVTCTGCAGLMNQPQQQKPQPNQQLLEIEELEHQTTEPLDYPENLENRIKSAVSVKRVQTKNQVSYEPVWVGNVAQNHANLPLAGADDSIYVLVDTETLYMVRSAAIAARENAKLVEKLDSVLELSTDERNQLLRVIKLEQYQMQRMQEFNQYYQSELERQETSHTIDSFTWRIITALALGVAI